MTTKRVDHEINLEKASDLSVRTALVVTCDHGSFPEWLDAAHFLAQLQESIVNRLNYLINAGGQSTREQISASVGPVSMSSSTFSQIEHRGRADHDITEGPRRSETIYYPLVPSLRFYVTTRLETTIKYSFEPDDPTKPNGTGILRFVPYRELTPTEWEHAYWLLNSLYSGLAAEVDMIIKTMSAPPAPPRSARSIFQSLRRVLGRVQS